MGEVFDGGVILDTPEEISFFRLLQMKHALGIEIKVPGMRHSRGSIMNLINREFGTNFRRKQVAYEFICKVVEEAKEEAKSAD